MFKYVCLCAFLLGLSLFWFAKEGEKGERERQLVVGLQSGYPPFEFVDEAGKIVGFDVEVAEKIAQAMQKQLVVKDMDFDGEIISLKQGKIDLIISGMNITASRKKEIAMVPYHGAAIKKLMLAFWNEIPQGVKGLNDFVNKPEWIVSVEAGSTTEEMLRKFPGVQVKTFPGALEPMMDVKFGKSKANLVAPDVALFLQGKHPEIVCLEVPLPEGVELLGCGIGVKKGNSQLIQKVEEIVHNLKQSGELQLLEKRWFGHD